MNIYKDKIDKTYGTKGSSEDHKEKILQIVDKAKIEKLL